MSDVLLMLLRVNLALAVAIAAVMALRLTVRRLFGAGPAYALWAAPPLVALAMLLPGRIVIVTQPLRAAGHATMVWRDVADGPSARLAPALDATALVSGLWLAGALASLAYLAWQQLSFSRAIRAGRAGPAVVGVLRPRIVTPRDFASRYTPREQIVVLAHERTHIARHDSRINAAVALTQCVSWFNPLVHVLSHNLRIDQELACDAAVVAAHPSARRAYAEALLKTQLAGRPLPLGCYWPAQAAHPLAQRIGLLSTTRSRWAGRRLGPLTVTLLILGGAGGAWAARPAQVVVAPAPVRAPVAPTAAAPVAAPGTPSRRRLAAQDPWPPLQRMTQRAIEPPFASQDADHHPRLLPPGFFGPAKKIHSAAAWSSVEPGSAVRVLATMTDPEGIPLTTDLIAFGSQSWYRLGYVRRNASHYRLFTSVVQRGDRLRVTAGLNKSFESLVSGTVELASGETGTIRLPGGQLITVTPELRAETPAEIAEGRRDGGRGFINVQRIEDL